MRQTLAPEHAPKNVINSKEPACDVLLHKILQPHTLALAIFLLPMHAFLLLLCYPVADTS